MVAIIPWTPAGRGMPDPAERIASALAGSHLRGGRPGKSRMTCGLSEVSDEPQDVPRLVQEAEAAVEIGTRIGRVGDVVRYGDLGVYRLLLKVGDLREIWHFASEVLGPLIEHDAAHRLDLVRTLTVFLDKGQSPKRAAQALQVHANTVANRLARIEQLISLDLADSDDLLVAHLAVKIVETQGVPNCRAGRLSRIS
jgi:DNA-binding PucR family transcriptional regulator